MMLVIALSTLAVADIGAQSAGLPASAASAPRCEVRLPTQPDGWNTVLAECDGRPVAIGASRVRATNLATARIAGAAQYADDMQQIYAVLSAPPSRTPWWALALAALLGTGGITAVGASLSGQWRRLPPPADPGPLPPDLTIHP